MFGLAALNSLSESVAEPISKSARELIGHFFIISLPVSTTFPAIVQTHVVALFAVYLAAFCINDSHDSHHVLNQLITLLIGKSTPILLANQAVFSTLPALIAIFSNLVANFNRFSVVLAAHNASVDNHANNDAFDSHHAAIFVNQAHHSTIASQSEATHTGSCSNAFANQSQLPYLAINACLPSSVQNKWYNHAAVSTGFVIALVIAVIVFTVDAGIFAYILAIFGHHTHFKSFAAHVTSHAHQFTSLFTLSINQSLNQASTSFFHLPVAQFHNCSTTVSHSNWSVYKLDNVQWFFT